MSLGMIGCGTPVQHWVAPASFLQWTADKTRSLYPAPPEPASGAVLAVARPEDGRLVEDELRGRGLRFGSDGSTMALYRYMLVEHRKVAPRDARKGDVLFFDVSREEPRCGGHAGVVEAVDADGRITFRELRAGETRRSYVTPAAPRRRRADDGRVLNTFLRIKEPNDPREARYFAGEMLCAVARVNDRAIPTATVALAR